MKISLLQYDGQLAWSDYVKQLKKIINQLYLFLSLFH